MNRSNELVLQTPEGVRFRYRLAGPAARFLAVSIDLATIMFISSSITSLGYLLGAISSDVVAAAQYVAYFVITFGYSILFEWLWRGQTIGKRVLKLRVVDADGLRLTSSQIIIRNLLRLVDLLPIGYTVGGVCLLFSSKLQRLGDLAANTVVIRIDTRVRPDLTPILGDSYNSLRAHPHLAARLRQSVDPAEAQIALEAVLRRDKLDAAARVQLFASLAEHFRSLMTFPGSSTLGLSDEQYVRDVVDLLFRQNPVAATVPQKILVPAYEGLDRRR
jgi:uncharacterized RDD family membrane protein YckC